MRFSQRIGKKPVKEIFQVENIDIELKNRLWNIFYTVLEALEFSGVGDSNRKRFYEGLWKDFYNLPLDEIPRTRFGIDDVLLKKYIKKWFCDAEWYFIFDFLEYLPLCHYKFGDTFIEKINDALRMEVSAYRFIDRVITQINTEEEVQEITQSIETTTDRHSVNQHLRTALEMLSDRNVPDYRNSIKESVSAVEAYCRILIGEEKSTLGKALAIIEKKHGLHGSLKTAFTALYGYTSDAGGIRHAILEDDITITFEDAKFMLVSCSAFINYLSSKLAL